MKWYQKKFINWVNPVDDELLNFLNRLSEINIPPENIKIVVMKPSWVNVYYYASPDVWSNK